MSEAQSSQAATANMADHGSIEKNAMNPYPNTQATDTINSNKRIDDGTTPVKSNRSLPARTLVDGHATPEGSVSTRDVVADESNHSQNHSESAPTRRRSTTATETASTTSSVATVKTSHEVRASGVQSQASHHVPASQASLPPQNTVTRQTSVSDQNQHVVYPQVQHQSQPQLKQPPQPQQQAVPQTTNESNMPVVGMVGNQPVVATTGHVVKEKKGRFSVLQADPAKSTSSTTPESSVKHQQNPIQQPSPIVGEKKGRFNVLPAATVPPPPPPDSVPQQQTSGGNRERTASTHSATASSGSANPSATNDPANLTLTPPVTQKKGRFVLSSGPPPITNANVQNQIPAQQQSLKDDGAQHNHQQQTSYSFSPSPTVMVTAPPHLMPQQVLYTTDQHYVQQHTPQTQYQQTQQHHLSQQTPMPAQLNTIAPQTIHQQAVPQQVVIQHHPQQPQHQVMTQLTLQPVAIQSSQMPQQHVISQNQLPVIQHHQQHQPQQLQQPQPVPQPRAHETPVVASKTVDEGKTPFHSTRPPSGRVPTATRQSTPGSTTANGRTAASTPTGLGKVFHFLEQMRTEVAAADKTIKTLQSDSKFLKERNKELEAKLRETERKLAEEKSLREAADIKNRTLRKKLKGLKLDSTEDAHEMSDVDAPSAKLTRTNSSESNLYDANDLNASLSFGSQNDTSNPNPTAAGTAGSSLAPNVAEGSTEAKKSPRGMPTQNAPSSPTNSHRAPSAANIRPLGSSITSASTIVSNGSAQRSSFVSNVSTTTGINSSTSSRKSYPNQDSYQLDSANGRLRTDANGTQCHPDLPVGRGQMSMMPTAYFSTGQSTIANGTEAHVNQDGESTMSFQSQPTLQMSPTQTLSSASSFQDMQHSTMNMTDIQQPMLFQDNIEQHHQHHQMAQDQQQLPIQQQQQQPQQQQHYQQQQQQH